MIKFLCQQFLATIESDSGWIELVILPGEVVKVVHDDGDEEVQHDEGAEEDEGDEVDVRSV